MPQTPTTRERFWLVESMRLTAFLKPDTAVNPDIAKGWWKSVSGVEPESMASEQHGRRNRILGPVAGGVLELVTIPNRLDWNLGPTPVEPSDKPMEVVALGPFGETEAVFLKLAKAWLSQAPALKRLALGMTLVHPVAETPEALDTLQARIKNVDFKMKVHEVSDFIYRINRRRKHQIQGGAEVVINRLQTWAPVTYGTMVGSLGIGGGGMQMRNIPGAQAAQLELDINTGQSREIELPQATLVPLLDTLFAFGTEIAEQGDVP